MDVSKLTSALSAYELEKIDTTPHRLTGGFKGLTPDQAQRLYFTAANAKWTEEELREKISGLYDEIDDLEKSKRELENKLKNTAEAAAAAAGKYEAKIKDNEFSFKELEEYCDALENFIERKGLTAQLQEEINPQIEEDYSLDR